MEKADESIRHLEILIFAAALKDAGLTLGVLQNAGYSARIVQELAELTRDITGAGLILLAEEKLTHQLLVQLNAALLAQPRWSDLPILTVTTGGSSAIASHERLGQIARYLPNVTLLERPVRLATLLTIVRTALSSRRKQFELKAILEDLERAKAEAERANQAKTMFLANMSHEIRTPLTAIVGFAGLLRNPEIGLEARQRYVEVIARNGDQLASLINDVLDLSKVESGKLEIEPREVAPVDLFNDLAKWSRPIVESKGLEFRERIEGALPDLIMADSARVRQIVLNLVSNAVKFTPSGVIELIASATNGRLSIGLTDTGIGMPVEVQAKLFKAFTQADSTTTRKYGGTGLGLALSKALALAMEGDLRLVSSNSGEGSHFELWVPAVTVTSAREQMAAQTTGRESLKGKHILLVEDSPDNVLLINQFLEDAGAEVTTASDGRAAVECALQKKFSVILMDIQMPVMDGLAATAELRRRKYDGPIIALTAHALREERDRSLLAGCDDHLTKPIDREILLAKIAQNLRST